MTTEQFLEDFRENLLGDDASLERKMQVTEWIEQPGLPANATVPQVTRVAGSRSVVLLVPRFQC